MTAYTPNLRHPYVRPSSLRTEYHDDIPKMWMNHHNNINNHFEMEPLTGGLSPMVGNVTASSLWSMFRVKTVVANNLIVTFISQSINSMGQNKTRCYLLLFIAIIAESYATALSKQAKEIGSTALFLWSCVVNFFCMVGFNICLAHIEVSVAYAIWSAFGTCIVAVVGIVCFQESYDLQKITCLALITAGVVGLNLRDAAIH